MTTLIENLEELSWFIVNNADRSYDYFYQLALGDYLILFEQIRNVKRLSLHNKQTTCLARVEWTNNGVLKKDYDRFMNLYLDLIAKWKKKKFTKNVLKR